jgi:hypothetical protein
MCRSKVAVNLQTFPKRLGCLSITILGGVDAAQIEAHFCRARHQTDGYSQRSIRLIDPALLGKSEAEIEMRAAQPRIELYSFAKLLHSGLQISSFREKLTEIASCFGVIRIQPKSLFEMTLRPIEFALPYKNIPEIKMSDAVIGSEFQGFQSGLSGLLDSTLLVIGISEVVVARRARSSVAENRPIDNDRAASQKKAGEQ